MAQSQSYTAAAGSPESAAAEAQTPDTAAIDDAGAAIVAESDDPADEPDRAAWPDKHEKALKVFKLASERERDNRAAYVDDVKFGRLGGNEQWPSQIVADRTAAGKPCLTTNMMPSFIHQVINDTRQNKPTINVRPVDSGADRWTAQILAGLIRHIEQASNADAAYDTAVDNAASGGFGYVRVVIDWTHDDSFDKEIYIRRIADPLTVYGDPRSMAVDSRDWNDAFILDWMPEDDFKEKYPDADASDFPADVRSLWCRDGEILVAEWWHREEVEREIVKLSNGWVIDGDEYADEKALFDGQGLTVKARRKAKSWKVCQYHMTGAEILEENPQPGRYIPIIPCYGEEVVVEGKRHLRSMIRDGKDPQRNFNYWQSKAAESAAMAARATWLGPSAAFGGDYAKRWDTAHVTNHPFLAFEGAISPTWVQLSGADPAAMQQAAVAADNMNRTIGIYKAGLGAPSNETSGVAINARKVEGDNGTFHFTDNLSRCITWIGNILIDLIPHVYTPGRIIRVLGPDGVENHAQLGERDQANPGPSPAPMGHNGGPPLDPLPMGPGPAAMPPQGPMPPLAAAGAPGLPGVPGGLPGATQGPMPSPMPAPVVAPPPMPMPAPPAPTPSAVPQPLEGKPDFGAIYDLGLGNYDVVVSAGPGYQTRRQEAADQMMQLVQHFPQLAAVIGDIIARNLDWPGADEIEERLKKLLPAQLRGDQDPSAMTPQLQAAIAQGQKLIQALKSALMQCQAELQQAKGDNTADVMKQEIARLSVQVDMFDAQTNRLEAETKRGEAIVGAVQNTAGIPAGQAARPNPMILGGGA